MRKVLFLLFCLCLASGVTAQDRASIERQFQSWLDQTVWPQARAKGVSRKTMNAAFDGVTLNWDLPDLIPPGSEAKTPKAQRQAEFGSPGRYFNAGSLQGATSVGRQMARRHAATLSRVEALMPVWSVFHKHL